MGAENWALFKLPSDEERDPPRCELCQEFICSYVTGVEQLLRLALWLDRQTRVGKENRAPEIIAEIQTRTAELTTSWTNYLSHAQSHATAESKKATSGAEQPQPLQARNVP